MTQDLTVIDRAQQLDRWLDNQRVANEGVKPRLHSSRVKVALSKHLLAAEIGAFIALAVCIVELLGRLL
jgi:hypothetical protein